ncbi:MAG: T9SS type A sorting domain-containing protein, partial [Saprospiraceae bacterium]
SQNGLEDANVELNGSHPALPPVNMFDMTDNSGAFNFSNALPMASNYTLTPLKDDNHLNGVTTYDLVLISKHILGLEPLTTPYKMIAADANKSNSITTFDIVELRKLILGIYTELPNNTSWRFVDKSFTFANPTNPFAAQFPEFKSVAAVQASQMADNFVSVKVGDVNGSAIANSLMSADDRTAGTLLFDVQDRAVKAGEEFTVNFKAAEQVAGYQFTMNLKGLEVVDIVPGAGMDQTNFGVFADAITTSFDGKEAAEFAVKFRATTTGQISNLLGVSSRITKAEAYKNDARLDVAFRFNGTTIAGVGFELYQNTPNPFISKTQIGFHLPEATEATLTIFDEAGRMIYTQRGDFAKGYNAITLDRNVINATGVLYYKVDTGSDSATRKMIQTK